MSPDALRGHTRVGSLSSVPKTNHRESSDSSMKSHIYSLSFSSLRRTSNFRKPRGPRLPNSSDLDLTHDGELRADAGHREGDMQRDAKIRRHEVGTAAAKLHQQNCLRDSRAPEEVHEKQQHRQRNQDENGELAESLVCAGGQPAQHGEQGKYGESHGDRGQVSPAGCIAPSIAEREGCGPSKRILG
jgi:hypothetical protein